MWRREVSLSTHLFPFHPLDEENLKFVKRCGFDSLEIWGMKPHFDYSDPSFIQKLKNILTGAGLSVKSIHLPFYRTVLPEPEKRGRFYISDRDEKRRKEAVEEVLMAIIAGVEVGAEIMVVHTGMEYPDSSCESLLKSISEILLKTEDLNVKLAVENGFRERTGLRDVLSLIEKFDHEKLGLCVDTGHLNIAGEWEIFSEIPPERIFEFHLADNNGTEDTHLLPYEGTLPVEIIYEKIWRTNSHLVIETGPVPPRRNIKRDVLLSAKCAGKIASALNMGERAYRNLRDDAEKSLFSLFRESMKSFIPMKGDASIRTYARTISGSGRSFVLMRIPGDSTMEEKLETQNPGRMLSSFLDVYSLLSHNGISVPPIQGEDRERILFFLEDEGDFLLEDFVLLSDRMVEELYGKSLSILLQIQGLRKGDSLAFRREFSEDVFKWEIDHFIEYGLKDTGIDCPAEVKEELYSLCREISSFPRVLCHRDYHSKNIIVKEGEIFIVDFQDALQGPPHYDIASLVFDSYTEVDEDFERALMERYYILARQGKIVGEERSSFFKNTLATALHRNLKAFGRFIFIKEEKGNPYFMRFLLPTLKKAIKNARALGLKHTLSLLEKRMELF